MMNKWFQCRLDKLPPCEFCSHFVNAQFNTICCIMPNRMYPGNMVGNVNAIHCTDAFMKHAHHMWNRCAKSKKCTGVELGPCPFVAHVVCISYFISVRSYLPLCSHTHHQHCTFYYVEHYYFCCCRCCCSFHSGDG